MEGLDTGWGAAGKRGRGLSGGAQARYAVRVLRGFWVLSWCAGVALVPQAGRAEDPLPAQVSEVGPRLAAVEVTTAKRVRHDWYFGGGFGLGGGNLRAATGGSSVAAAGWLRAGARLSDRVGLGGSLASSVGGAKGGGVAGFTNVLAEALFFPVKGRGLGLGVGLGLSSAWLRETVAEGVQVEKQSRFGGGLAVGLGYDFWLARRFNLGLWLRGDASAGGYGLRGSGTFGLGFSWY